MHKTSVDDMFRKYHNGRVERPDGEICYIHNERFHRIDGPARFMPDGRHLHYFNGNDITVEIEQMYADGHIKWVDEANHRDDKKHILTPASCFTVELAFSGLTQGIRAAAVFANESAVSTGFKKGQLYTLGTGKTSYYQTAVYNAVLQGKTIAFVDYEM